MHAQFKQFIVWDSKPTKFKTRQVRTVQNGKSANMYSIIPVNIIHYMILYSLYILSNTEAHYTDSHYVSVPASYWGI